MGLPHTSANEIARLTVNKLENGNEADIPHAIVSFMKTAHFLEGPTFAFSIQQLKKGLLQRKPEWRGDAEGLLRKDIAQEIMQCISDSAVAAAFNEPKPVVRVRR